MLSLLLMAFNVQLVRTYWGTNRAGEINATAFKMAIDERSKKLAILAEAGVVMSD